MDLTGLRSRLDLVSVDSPESAYSLEELVSIQADVSVYWMLQKMLIMNGCGHLKVQGKDLEFVIENLEKFSEQIGGFNNVLHFIQIEYCNQVYVTPVDRFFSSIASSTNLTKIKLSYLTFETQIFSSLLSGCSNVFYLSLEYCVFPETEKELISRAVKGNKISILSLVDFTDSMDLLHQFINNCPNLNTLQIDSNSNSDQFNFWSLLSNLKNLESISLMLPTLDLYHLHMTLLKSKTLRKILINTIESKYTTLRALDFIGYVKLQEFFVFGTLPLFESCLYWNGVRPKRDEFANRIAHVLVHLSRSLIIIEDIPLDIKHLILVLVMQGFYLGDEMAILRSILDRRKIGFLLSESKFNAVGLISICQQSLLK